MIYEIRYFIYRTQITSVGNINILNNSFRNTLNTILKIAQLSLCLQTLLTDVSKVSLKKKVIVPTWTISTPEGTINFSPLYIYSNTFIIVKIKAVVLQIFTNFNKKNYKVLSFHRNRIILYICSI